MSTTKALFIICSEVYSEKHLEREGGGGMEGILTSIRREIRIADRTLLFSGNRTFSHCKVAQMIHINFEFCNDAGFE